MNRRMFVEECSIREAKLKWLKIIEKIGKMKEPHTEKAINNLDREVTELLISGSNKRKNEPKPPISEN